jgi:hypothetical protein
MADTLKRCGHLLDIHKDARENFFTVQDHLMSAGSTWLPAMRKTSPLWVGDKKPFQYTDPELVAFILTLFPEARFIHLIRHPFAVALSVCRFNRTPDGDFWKDLTFGQCVEQWAFHEKKVLELKQHLKGRVLDVRYEDLCRDTSKELIRIFGFLNLDSSEIDLPFAVGNMRTVIEDYPNVTCSAEARQIMSEYGYRPEGVRYYFLKKIGRVLYGLFIKARDLGGVKHASDRLC